MLFVPVTGTLNEGMVKNMNEEFEEALIHLENGVSAFNMILMAIESEGEKAESQEYKALSCIQDQLAQTLNKMKLIVDGISHGKGHENTVHNDIEKEMKVIDFLLKKTKVNDIIMFTDSGWCIGITRIDHEDLFTRSLNPKLLNRNVKNHFLENVDWSNGEITVVEI